MRRSTCRSCDFIEWMDSSGKFYAARGPPDRGLAGRRPLPWDPTENFSISTVQTGDVPRCRGLRLDRVPIRTTVRSRSENSPICDYRIGGVDRHLVVDLVDRTRRPVLANRVHGRASMRWCRSLLED